MTTLLPREHTIRNNAFAHEDVTGHDIGFDLDEKGRIITNWYCVDNTCDKSKAHAINLVSVP